MRYVGPGVLLTLAGCASAAGGRQEACGPVPVGEIAIAPAALAGGYRITLVSSGGGRSTGSLALGPSDAVIQNAPQARQVLEGALQVALDSLGASVPGGMAPRDARIVGVSAGRELTLRLEPSPASGGMQPVEGSYVAFSVHRASVSRMDGVWRSGNGRREVVRGHFCAVRVPS